MALNVSLILPNNLVGSITSEPFLNGGAILVPVASAGDSTSVAAPSVATITFGVALTDAATFLPVALHWLSSVQISNDPAFSATATKTITDWPAGGFSSSSDYFYDINTNAASSSAGTGLFHILNWPLSGTGGTETVYLAFICASSSDTSALYPGSAGLAGQIVSQTVAPSRPGRPEAKDARLSPLASPPVSGARTIWAFRNATETASGFYESGVSRYMGDILEIYPSDFYSSVASVPSVTRTLAPLRVPTTLTVETGTIPTSGSPATSSTYSAVSPATFSDTAYRYFTGLTTLWPSTSGNLPSVGLQTHFSITGLATSAALILTARLNSNISSNAASAANQLSVDTYLAPVGYQSYSRCTVTQASDLIFVSNWTPIPQDMAAKMRGGAGATGGVVEVYVSLCGLTEWLVQAYYSPLDGTEGSALLYSGLAPVWDTTSDASLKAIYPTLLCAMQTAGQSASVQCAEIVIAGGRFVLDADLGLATFGGSGSANDVGFTQTSASGAGWVEALSTGDWQSRTLTTDTSVGVPQPSVSVVSNTLRLYAPAQSVSRTFSETVAALPSLATNVQLNWTMTHTSGRFYCAFSPQSILPQQTAPQVDFGPYTGFVRNSTDGTSLDSAVSPMGTRVDYWRGGESKVGTTVAPTLAIIFDQARNQITLAQRLATGELVQEPLLPYAPLLASNVPTSENWSVRLTEGGEAARGVWITILRGTDIIGTWLAARALAPQPGGTGWYVALGAASEAPFAFDVTGQTGQRSQQDGSVSLASTSYKALPAPDASLSPLVSYVLTARTEAVGASQLPAYWGECLISGKSDTAPDFFAAPASLTFGNPVKAVSAGEPVNLASTTTTAVATLDGVTLADGDRVLLKDQADPSENGPYEVVMPVADGGAGTGWVRDTDLSSSSSLPTSNQAGVGWQVIMGTLNTGTIWWIAPPPAGTTLTLGTSPLLFLSNVYLQSFTRSQIGTLSPLSVAMIDVRMRCTSQAMGTSAFPRVRLIARNSDGSLGSPVTGWISGLAASNLSYLEAETIAPYQDIVQFGIGLGAASITDSSLYYLAVEIPLGCELICANSRSTGLILSSQQGWNAVDSLWHKIFAARADRRDNSIDGATIQMRVRADSHARFSGQPSALSASVLIDRLPPAGVGETDRPVVTLPVPPSLRSALLDISAADANSGVGAFRVGVERDGLATAWTPWLSWSQFYNSATSSVRYTAYLYGQSPLTAAGSSNASPATDTAHNAPFDGSRRVRVEVMDNAGNVAEGYPLTILAQSLAYVTTAPPSATSEFVSSANGTPVPYTNQTNLLAAVDLTSQSQDAKDMRLRVLGASSWDAWRPYDRYVARQLNASTDGVKRHEIQVRDWGNNSQQIGTQWEDLSSFPLVEGVVFLSTATWTPPGAATQVLYLGGARTDTYSSLALTVVQGSTFPTGCAFYASVASGSLSGRLVQLRTTDRTTISVNSVTYTAWRSGTIANPFLGAPSNSYYIDPQYGYVVFQTPPSGGAVLTGSLQRESGVLYSWDGSQLLRLADLGPRGERAITALESCVSGLIVGCASGSLYAWTGATMRPLTTCTDATTGDALPVTSLFVFRFAHETGAFVYAATGAMPRLFRAPEALAALRGESWEAVMAPSGYLAGNSGTITSMTGAYDSLFLGSKEGTLTRYTRTLNRTNLPDVTETFVYQTLAPSALDPSLSTSAVPISDLTTAQGQVLAAIGDRPEIYQLVEVEESTTSPHAWFTQPFDASFAYQPAPWQLFASNGNTDNTQDDGQTVPPSRLGVVWPSVITSASGGGDRALRDVIFLQGGANKFAFYGTAPSSYWSQVIAGQTAWTIEADVAVAIGTGSQQIQISDGRYVVSLSISPYTLSLQSGTNVVTATINFPDGIPDGEEGSNSGAVTAMSDSPETGNRDGTAAVFPDRGQIVWWNFQNATTTTPGGFYAQGGIPGMVLAAQSDNWVTSANTGALVNGTESSVDPLLFGQNVDYLKIPTIAGTSPGIQWLKTVHPQGFRVDAETQVMVRFRFDSLGGRDLGTVRFGWSDSQLTNSSTLVWESVPVSQGTDYVTYVFSPVWSGYVEALYLAWDNCTHYGLTPNILVDYVAVVQNDGLTRLSDNMTSVRIAASGTRVTVWAGKSTKPLIDQDNFLTLPDTRTEIRFGKLAPTSEASTTFVWGALRFIVGQYVAPLTPRVLPMRIKHRLSNASGAVRKFALHEGALWALTDGTVRPLANYPLDNPDDRASHCFRLDPDTDEFVFEAPPYERNSDGTAIVRPFTVASYQGTMLVSGQTAQVVPT